MISYKELVAVKKKYITVNHLNIRRNIERIKFLETCIDLTSKDTGALETAVNNSASHQSEVDALLNTTYQ